MGSLAIQPNSRRAYGLSIVLLLLALGAQWSLRPVLGTAGPFLFILPAMLAAGGRFFHPLGRIGVRMADEEPTPDDPTADTHTTAASPL